MPRGIARHFAKAAIGTVAAVCLLLAMPLGASAAVTCDFTGNVLTVTVTTGTPFPTLSQDDDTDAISVDDDTNFANGDVTCTTGTPTDTTTSSIVVNEVGSNQGTSLTLEFDRGRLAPGLSAEPSGVPEIEVTYSADANGSDELLLSGDTETADQSFQFGTVGGGVNGDLNNDDDADDVQLTGVDLLFLADPGSGNDTFTGDGTGDASFTGPVNVEMTAFGSQGNETFRAGNAESGFTGGLGNDSVVGGASEDGFHMEEGNDTFDGGGGTQDFASYENFPSAAGVTIDLSQAGPQNTGPDTGIDQVVNAENVVGTNGPDRVTGDNGDNLVFGGNLVNDAGNDVVSGLGGNDTVFGRAGNDLLIGGAGNDGIQGEAGNDTASFALGSVGPVTFSLNPALTGTQQMTGGAGNDTLQDSVLGLPDDPDTNHEVENLIGSPFGMDSLTGNALDNRINVLDGLLDTVDCVDNADMDRVVADEIGVDTINMATCESIDNAPQTSIDSGPADGATINNSTPTYMLSANEASDFQVSVNGGVFQPCPSSCSVGPLSDGTHQLAFRAVDQDENMSPDQTPAMRTVTISTAPPPTIPPTVPPAPLAQTPVTTGENPDCATLRAKLKKAKSKKKKRKIRRGLRQLGC